MNDIRAPQIKAARALLDWSQEELANKARLSVTTIRTMELGFVPKDGTVEKIRKTLDQAGVELTEGDGVRRRPEEMRSFRGHDSCERLFESVEESVSDYSDNLLVLMVSGEVWLQPNGSTGETNLQRLEKLRDTVRIKCLLTDNLKLPLQPSAIQFQYLPESSRSSLNFCTLIYGNKFASIQMINRTDFFVTELCIPVATLRFREKYLSLWEKASSLKPKPSQSKPKKRG